MTDKYYDMTLQGIQERASDIQLAISDAQDAIETLKNMVVEQDYTLTREHRNDILGISSDASVIVQEGYPDGQH